MVRRKGSLPTDVVGDLMRWSSLERVLVRGRHDTARRNCAPCLDSIAVVTAVVPQMSRTRARGDLHRQFLVSRLVH